jgi:hypothetical protein
MKKRHFIFPAFIVAFGLLFLSCTSLADLAGKLGGKTGNSNPVVTNEIPVWNNFPSEGITPGSADYIDMKMDNNGSLVMAFKDGNTGGKLSVMRFTNGIWTNVGPAGISAGTADYIALCIDPSNNYYAGYSDGSTGGRLSVKKWDGSSWSSYYNAVSSGTASYISIAWHYQSSQPVFAYSDGAHSGHLTRYISPYENINLTSFPVTHTSVVVHDSSGQSFTYIYCINDNTKDICCYYYAGLLLTEFSNTGSLCLSVYSTSCVPYLDYLVSKSCSNNKAQVWSSDAFTNLTRMQSNVSIAAVDCPRIYAENSNVYIAFTDGNAGNKATCMKWGGTEFSLLGSAGFSAEAANYITLVVSNNITYVGYKDTSVSNKATVKCCEN